MRTRITALTFALVLAIPSIALAATPTEDAYQAPTGQVASNVTSSSTGGADTLPFTGLDLILVAVLGIGLLAVGLVVRRYAGRDAA